MIIVQNNICSSSYRKQFDIANVDEVQDSSIVPLLFFWVHFLLLIQQWMNLLTAVLLLSLLQVRLL